MTRPLQLSHELRRGQTDHMSRRRWIIGLSMVGAAMGQIVGLYQTGIIRRLPDPPLRIFDSSRVDASEYAYSRLDLPDAFLMTIGYAMTAALAAAGNLRRAREQSLIPLALLGKVAFDLAVALELGREEWRDNKALCFYCQMATVASLASLVLALPEAREAWESMQRGQDGSAVSHFADEVVEKAESLAAVP